MSRTHIPRSHGGTLWSSRCPVHAVHGCTRRIACVRTTRNGLPVRCCFERGGRARKCRLFRSNRRQLAAGVMVWYYGRVAPKRFIVQCWSSGLVQKSFSSGGVHRVKHMPLARSLATCAQRPRTCRSKHGGTSCREQRRRAGVQAASCFVPKGAACGKRHAIARSEEVGQLSSHLVTWQVSFLPRSPRSRLCNGCLPAPPTRASMSSSWFASNRLRYARSAACQYSRRGRWVRYLRPQHHRSKGEAQKQHAVMWHVRAPPCSVAVRDRVPHS